MTALLDALTTVAAIVAATLTYNADDVADDATVADLINAGVAVIRVTAIAQGNGHTVRAVIVPGVETAVGFAAAADPVVKIVRGDTRLPADERARRALRLTADVPVRYVNRRGA